jgi:hypothetical protein
MTYKVTVTNSDSQEAALIHVQAMGMSTPEQSCDRPNGPAHELRKGESAEVYVHKGQYLLVREGKAW